MKSSISIGQHTGLAQRVKWQYVSLAAGLGLAATAAIGFRGPVSTPTEPAAPVRATIASMPAPQDHPTVVFYLVKSPEAAGLAETYEEVAHKIRVDGNIPEPRRSVVILDATTEEASNQAHHLIDEAMAAGNFTTYEAPQFVISELR